MAGAPDGLTHLPADYALAVLDPNGNTIAASDISGTCPESFNAVIRETGTWYVLVNSNKSGQFSPTEPYYLKVEVGPSFIDRSDLVPFSPNILTGTYQFAWAELKDNFGDPITGRSDVKVKVDGYAWPMYDDGSSEHDLEANDGVYSMDLVSTQTGPHTVELFIGGKRYGASRSYTTLATASADLMVITDKEALNDEFGVTGTADGFFDLMDRLYDYAKAHGGVVFDVAEEMVSFHSALFQGQPGAECSAPGSRTGTPT